MNEPADIPDGFYSNSTGGATLAGVAIVALCAFVFGLLIGLQI